MKYEGREVDPLRVWEPYVTFPSSMKIRSGDTFSPKVECPNPDHDTLKHHFQINLSQPTVHCFAHCGISGSWNHAICVIEGLYEKYGVDLDLCRSAFSKHARERTANEKDALRRRLRAFRDARRIILKTGKTNAASAVRKNSERSRPRKSTAPVRDLSFESYLPQVALDYLDEREISASSISAFTIGWHAEDKRIVIPARDENGAIKFLIKRAVLKSQNPKYLYTEGFPKTSLLFGACHLDLGMVKSRGLIVVEGSIDCIKLHQHGLRNTVAILGTGISEEQRRIIARLRPKKITLMFDKDSAGIHNIEIAAGLLRKYPLYVVRYPNGKTDPATLTAREANRSVERAIPLREFASRLQDFGMSFSPNVRKEISVGS
jgi:hypothetical protein